MVDPNKHNLGQRCVEVWSDAMVALAERIELGNDVDVPLANEEERSDFLQDIQQDLHDPKYELYCNMYS